MRCLTLLTALTGLILVGCDDKLLGEEYAGTDGGSADTTGAGSGGAVDTGGTGGGTGGGGGADGGTTGGGGTDGGSVDTASPEEGFCAVLSLFAAECLLCHSAASASGGLDLETDPHGALVGVSSASYGAVLVAPGDPSGSLLYAKMTDTQAADQGGVMPPSGVLPAADVQVVYDWIAEGASGDCEGGVDTGIEPSRYHPEGWADPAEHGMAAKYQEDDCLSCHGETLDGVGDAVSCDTCHTPHDPTAWRTDCTFCHGGTDNLTGAPPVDISGESEPALLSFSPHSAHVEDTSIHLAFDCTQCHVKPEDVLSIGHFLVDDATPGVAETDLSAGLSSRGYWFVNTCANLYCHGDGQGDNGSVSVGESVGACDDCHADRSSGEAAWDRMSGRHKKHLKEGILCSECHADTTDSAQNIIGLEYHVNGSVEVSIAGSVSWNGTGCYGSCHGEYHSYGENTWLGGDD